MYIRTFVEKNREISRGLVGKEGRVIIKRYPCSLFHLKREKDEGERDTTRCHFVSENYANSCNKGCRKLSAHLGLAVTASN